MSCLFNSISHFVHVPPADVRSAVCKYLEDGNPIIEGMATRDVLDLDRADYVQQMRQPSTWGGAIEIQAACNLYGLHAVVHDTRTSRGIEFLPIACELEPRKIELRWSGGHFEPA